MIEEKYNHLIDNARSINPNDYTAFKDAVFTTIDEKLNSVPKNYHPTIYPINYKSRIDYIESRPNQYHSVIQLKSIYDEFIKRYAAFQIKNQS